MSQNAWIGLIVAIIIIGGGAWWFMSQQVAAPVVVDNSMTLGDTTTTDTGTQTDVNTNTAPMSATVTYSGSSFTPSEVTIKKGGTVTFNGPSSMDVASGMHPTHTNYDGTSRATHCAPGYTGAAPFDECTQGSSYSFTFDKVGTWGYHDHNNESAFGKVIVIE